MSQVQNTAESEKNSEWKKKTKKMTLQRPSWTKKTKKNSTVARLPKPLPGRNSFSLAVGWAVFAGVRSTEWNRSYTWGKRSRRCNFWGVLGGGVAKRGKFDVSNGRKLEDLLWIWVVRKGCFKKTTTIYWDKLLAPNLSCLMFYAFAGAFL